MRPIGNVRNPRREQKFDEGKGQDSTARIFVSAKGRKYGSWISSGRSNPLGYTTSDFIESPAYAIESILRDELGASSIAVATFDTVANAQSSLKIAFSWNRERLAYQEIDEICEEFGLVLLVNGSGQYALRRMAEVAQDFSLVENDILDGENSFRVYRLPPESIANEFIFRYKYNYALNVFDEELHMTATKVSFTVGEDARSGFRDTYTYYSGMLSGSRTVFGTRQKMIFEAQHTRDRTTAVVLMKRLIDWHALQRVVVECDLPFSKLVNHSTITPPQIEHGDLVKVTNSLLPETTSNLPGTTAVNANALFVVTKKIFDPASLVTHLSLHETPYKIT